jgi:8-oxo-dGTP diphosphatase
MRVVAAAIVRDGRVLAARRTRPEHHAGRWEFPGGKVEPDETDEQALARECHEELGVTLQVGERLGEAAAGATKLVLYGARVLAGEPAAGPDHDAVAWLGADQLATPQWLAIDRALLGAVRAYLGAQRNG